jgi:hypothetical protein
MSEPRNVAEYLARFHANQRIEGYGIQTTTITPCPFCGAPDWMRWPILEAQEAMQRGATCLECGRSAKAVFHVNEPGNKQFEFVQTGGPDQPEWFTPKMRRVEG